MEVWSDREDKKKLLEELGEPGKFVILDTKILAAPRAWRTVTLLSEF